MSILLMNKPGAVVRLDDPAVQCQTYFQMPGKRPDYNVHRSIVTRVVGGYKVNLQVLNTFGEGAYVYVFSDRPAGIMVSGLSFCGCDASASHGLSLMYDWWLDNKASNTASPINMIIGRRNLRGVLDEFSHDAVSVDRNLASWQANIIGLPDKPR